MDILKLIGREQALFYSDIQQHELALSGLVSNSRFLVIGGAGSIGQAVTSEIFKRQPKVLHVVDISENNMVELVRDFRSTLGYITGDFSTFAIDCGSLEFEALLNCADGYDYILNLSALKHVRSEKDPFTLMRMIDTNIINTVKIAELAKNIGVHNFFCVSTDKAANPVNMMGASKRIMEKYLMRASLQLPISMARFANVAFSDGSLLHGFNQRFAKRQPISAPRDVQRYFVTPQEAGELCLMSCLLGKNRDVFFPKLSEKLHLISFPEIAIKYLAYFGYEAYECSTETEARICSNELIAQKKWPCCFFDSDTTGEKDCEEFFTDSEILDLKRFNNIGIIKNEAVFDNNKLDSFLNSIAVLKKRMRWNKSDLVALFQDMDIDFKHKDVGKYLDEKM